MYNWTLNSLPKIGMKGGGLELVQPQKQNNTLKSADNAYSANL